MWSCSRHKECELKFNHVCLPYKKPALSISIEGAGQKVTTIHGASRSIMRPHVTLRSGDIHNMLAGLRYEFLASFHWSMRVLEQAPIGACSTNKILSMLPGLAVT